MQKIKAILAISTMLFIAAFTVLNAQNIDTTFTEYEIEETVESEESPFGFEEIRDFFNTALPIILLLLAAADVIVRVTPTEKDNNVLRIIQSWLDYLVPNVRKEGPNFVAFKYLEDKPKLGVIIEPKEKQKKCTNCTCS